MKNMYIDEIFKEIVESDRIIEELTELEDLVLSYKSALSCFESAKDEESKALFSGLSQRFEYELKEQGVII